MHGYYYYFINFHCKNFMYNFNLLLTYYMINLLFFHSIKYACVNVCVNGACTVDKETIMNFTIII